MRIRVLMFAALAADTGTRELDLQLADDLDATTVADALDHLIADHPAIAAHRPQLALAVNAAYVDPSHPLTDGDELALIPPVSGGK